MQVDENRGAEGYYNRDESCYTVTGTGTGTGTR